MGQDALRYKVIAGDNGIKISLHFKGRMQGYEELRSPERRVEHHKRNQALLFTGRFVSFCLSTRFSMSIKIPTLPQPNVN